MSKIRIYRNKRKLRVGTVFTPKTHIKKRKKKEAWESIWEYPSLSKKRYVVEEIGESAVKVSAYYWNPREECYFKLQEYDTFPLEREIVTFPDAKITEIKDKRMLSKKVYYLTNIY